jgi:hypothetical protein
MDLGWLFGSSTAGTDCAIEELFPLALTKDCFVESDIQSTYLKILTDTVDRTFGIPKDVEPLLWDNCLQSETSMGLISSLAKAMAECADLFLVYEKGNKLLRKATAEEEKRIREDYKNRAESSVGVFISFKNYRRTKMLEIYSSFEYCVVASLNKQLNLSKSIQLKLNALRGSTALADASVAKTQAQGIASALRNGKDIYMDAEDSVETAKVDMEPTKEAVTFIEAKKAFILSLPISYLNGELQSGLSDTGEGDMRAVERGLKQYFVSIIQPAVKAVFGVDTTFKTQDFRNMASGGELVKTLDLISPDLLSLETRQDMVCRVWEIDPVEERKRIEKESAEREAEAEKNIENGAQTEGNSQVVQGTQTNGRPAQPVPVRSR